MATWQERNKQSRWWGITWNNYPPEWKNYLLGNYVSKGKKGQRTLRRRISSKIKRLPKILRVIAVKELSPEGKLHIHEVVEFEKSVYRSQMYNFFNDTAYNKPLKYDTHDPNGYDKEVNYLIKTQPQREDVIAWPSVSSWIDFKCIRDFFHLSLPE